MRFLAWQWSRDLVCRGVVNFAVRCLDVADLRIFLVVVRVAFSVFLSAVAVIGIGQFALFVCRTVMGLALSDDDVCVNTELRAFVCHAWFRLRKDDQYCVVTRELVLSSVGGDALLVGTSVVGNVINAFYVDAVIVRHSRRFIGLARVLAVPRNGLNVGLVPLTMLVVVRRHLRITANGEVSWIFLPYRSITVIAVGLRRGL